MEKCLSLHWRVYLFRSVWMSLCHYVIMSRLTSHICTYYVTLTSATIKNYLFYKTSWPFYLIPWPPRRWDEMRGDCNKYPWIICSAQPHHSGNYTCKPSSSTPASIQLFVLGEKNILFLSCKFLANDHIRKHLLPRWSPQWYGDLVLKRAWLWLVNYYFYIDLKR